MVLIGKYTLQKNILLGSGSFSKVYQGTYNDKLLAIKIIKINRLTKKALSIIDNEIKIMNIIKNDPHPNIVECYDIIKTDRRVYIILEYCDSKDLLSIMIKPIKELYTQFYFSQLVNGLKYLDKKNIIHRDIKPKNILLTNNRKVLKIADFGFAIVSKIDDLHDTICGSPLYMAPEITSTNAYNAQTDLWSIGMILYEMLYGHHPYHKCKTREDLKYRIDNTEIMIPPKDNKNTDISDECICLLRSLLQKNVRYRIKWDQFFKHDWITKYDNSIYKHHEDYKKQLCSTSFGSFGVNTPTNITILNTPNISNTSNTPNSNNIRHNYLTNIITPPTIHIPITNISLKESKTLASVKIVDNYLDDPDNPDTIFDIEC